MKRFLSAICLVLMVAALSAAPSPAQAWFSAEKIFAFGSGSAVPSAPVNTIAPVASGDLYNTGVLTCSPGTWTGSPYPTFAYKWQQNTVDISGATSSTYTANSTTAAGTLRCVVTATNGSGSASANSNNITPFNPNAVSAISGWYDAADTSSITNSSGFASQVNDKSGTGNNATQGTAANRPSTGSVTINGLNALGCDGTNDYLIIPVATLGANQPALSIAAVFVPNNTNTALMLISNNNGSNGGRSQVWNQGQNMGGAAVTRITPTSGSTLLQITRTPANGSNRVSTLKINNEAQLSSAPSTRGAVAGTAAAICSFGTPSGYLNGSIGEIIVAQVQWTDAQSNRIAHYLAGKWGVTYSDLP